MLIIGLWALLQQQSAEKGSKRTSFLIKSTSKSGLAIVTTHLAYSTRPICIKVRRWSIRKLRNRTFSLVIRKQLCIVLLWGPTRPRTLRICMDYKYLKIKRPRSWTTTELHMSWQLCLTLLKWVSSSQKIKITFCLSTIETIKTRFGSLEKDRENMKNRLISTTVTPFDFSEVRKSMAEPRCATAMAAPRNRNNHLSLAQTQAFDM